MRLSELINLAVKSAILSNFNANDMQLWIMRLQSAISQWSNKQRPVREIVENAMQAEFKKAIKTDNLIKAHKGIEPFRIQHLTPKARDLLQDSIIKNVQLIKLSKQSAEDLTLRRFSSWYTGGDDSQHQRTVASHILKPLYNTDYENRRLLNDQGHKLIAAINNAIATDGGAIAMRWHQNWTQDPRDKGKSPQTNHKQFDNKIFVIKTNNPYVSQGILKAGPNGYLEDIGTMPAQEVNCVCSGAYYYSLNALYRDYPEAFTEKGKAMIKGNK